MTTAQYAGNTVEVDAEGFLMDAGAWSREIAQEIANELGIGELTDRHWQVIDFMREDYAAEGQSPGLRRITQKTGIPMKELYQLFPKGPGKRAAMIAGLPKPKACI